MLLQPLCLTLKRRTRRNTFSEHHEWCFDLLTFACHSISWLYFRTTNDGLSFRPNLCRLGPAMYAGRVGNGWLGRIARWNAENDACSWLGRCTMRPESCRALPGLVECKSETPQLFGRLLSTVCRYALCQRVTICIQERMILPQSTTHADPWSCAEWQRGRVVKAIDLNVLQLPAWGQRYLLGSPA